MVNLYNTLTKKEETLDLQNPFKIYTCGPTVYDRAHIGNFRSYVTVDLLKRLLLFKKVQITHVINITDVGHLTLDDFGEDKLLVGLKRHHSFKTPEELARYYENLFIQDFKTLNFLMPAHFPRATDYVFQMAQHIQTLIQKGFAYQTSSGNVYFRVKKFEHYGSLSGNTLSQLLAGQSARVKEENNQEKEDLLDFALWKTDPNHLMKWQTVLGEGFPGWHIECSTMGLSLLGDEVDLHTGGEDNIFPHHECEIAQTESLTGKPWVKHWLHTRHLFVEGKKMSKSEKNFLTLGDLQNHHPFVIRLTLLGTHYQKMLDFTFKDLERNRDFLNQILQVQAILNFRSKRAEQAPTQSHHQVKEFVSALEANLNIALAMKALHLFLDDVVQPFQDHSLSKQRLLDLKSMLSILGLELEKLMFQTDENKISNLIETRQRAKKEKNFQLADEIRHELKKEQIECLDLPEGSVWYHKV
jgi:cysteinyl-tRNA synthetase